MAITDQRNRRKGSRGPVARDTSRSVADVSAGRSGGPSSGGPSSGPDVSAESVAEAISLLESFVADFEPGRYSGEDAAVLVDRFARGEHLCVTGKALAAKRAAETELHRRDGSRSAAEWLSRKTGDSLGAATGSLQLADQMAASPGLADALRSGELSTSRARQVADVLKIDPTSEDELVEAAKDPTETNRQLADRCLRAKAKARSAEESHAAYERIRAARFLRHYTDRDGAFRLEGLFTPDAGAKLLAALKPTRTVIFDEARRQGLRERPDAYEADALVALVTGERQRAPRPPRAPSSGESRATGGDTGQAGTDKAARASDKRAGAAGTKGRAPHRGSADLDEDGSGDAVEDDGGQDNAVQDDAGQDDAGQTTTGCSSTALPPPASVHLRVDLAALRRGQLQAGECCEIPGVGPVPLEVAREVLGDAIMHLVITKGSDIASITNLGRTVRAPLRRALIARDETCVVPGCDVREGLEIDHRIIPVVENGPTALWNLARICSRHHYLRHHQGFRLEGGPGDWQWLPPEKPPPPDRDGSGRDESGSGDDDRLFKLK